MARGFEKVVQNSNNFFYQPSLLPYIAYSNIPYLALQEQFGYD
jgi:hypothetical protein